MYYHRYNALDGMVKATGMNGVLKKMLIDQLLFVPTCQILFYSGNSILEVSNSWLFHYIGSKESATSYNYKTKRLSLAFFTCISLLSIFYSRQIIQYGHYYRLSTLNVYHYNIKYCIYHVVYSSGIFICRIWQIVKRRWQKEWKKRSRFQRIQ